jgi:hypothetical protein
MSCTLAPVPVKPRDSPGAAAVSGPVAKQQQRAGNVRGLVVLDAWLSFDERAISVGECES